MTEKPFINGLKLSEPMVLIRVRCEQPASGVLPQLCRLLAQGQVNIAFLTSVADIEDPHVLCCIEPKDRPAVAAWVEQSETLKAGVCLGGDVGIVTFYPHHSNLRLMGMALQLFSRNHIEVHALASSIAALSFVVDSQRLEDAGRLVVENFRLPENASPLRADFKVCQERRPG